MNDLTLTEVLAVWGIRLNKRQALQLLGEMMAAEGFMIVEFLDSGMVLEGNDE